MKIKSEVMVKWIRTRFEEKTSKTFGINLRPDDKVETKLHLIRDLIQDGMLARLSSSPPKQMTNENTEPLNEDFFKEGHITNSA